MVWLWWNYSKNRIRNSGWADRPRWAESDGAMQDWGFAKLVFNDTGWKNLWTFVFFLWFKWEGQTGWELEVTEEGVWVLKCFMKAFKRMTHLTHLCSSLNVKTSNNPSLWHLRWCVMSQLTESWFPKKRGRWLKASAFEPTQHYQATQRLNLSSLRSLRAAVVLRCSFHSIPAPQTWNIALILINLNWINEIIIGNSLATWMQWRNLRNIRLMFYFSSLILTFLCCWTHVHFVFLFFFLHHCASAHSVHYHASKM